MKTPQLTTPETAKELGLRPEEYDRIIEILGRVPNFTELSIFSVMWSEHCSYKNSITWLKTLPKDGARMLAKAGEENAGMVDLGDGIACVFKIECQSVSFHEWFSFVPTFRIAREYRSCRSAKFYKILLVIIFL